MSRENIEPGSLVIILDEEAIPIIRMGLVVKIFPSGENCDVKIGPSREEKAIISRGKLFHLIQTDGKFSDPKTAFDHYRDDIIIELVMMNALSRELQEIKRLKTRQRRIDSKLRYRIGRSLASLLSRVPFTKKT